MFDEHWVRDWAKIGAGADALKPGQSYTITRSHLREYIGGEEGLEDLDAAVDFDEA